MTDKTLRKHINICKEYEKEILFAGEKITSNVNDVLSVLSVTGNLLFEESLSLLNEVYFYSNKAYGIWRDIDEHNIALRFVPSDTMKSHTKFMYSTYTRAVRINDILKITGKVLPDFYIKELRKLIENWAEIMNFCRVVSTKDSIIKKTSTK